MTHPNTKHGMRDTPEYATWCRMKKRCYNKNVDSYKRYGGRGIVVCAEWLNSFKTFWKDMGPKPTKHHSIDRIDNDGPYSKANCRWATPKEQALNRTYRKGNLLKYNGIELNQKDWAKRLRISQGTLNYRIQKWGVKKALSIPNKFEVSVGDNWAYKK